jgi:hypothetical protein
VAVLLVLLVLWGVFLAVRRAARAARLHGQPRRTVRPPRPQRTPPPDLSVRMMLTYGEMPAAALALASGRRSRARLRLILAMRREKALDRYYAQLGRLQPGTPPDDGLAERVAQLEDRTRQLASERRRRPPGAFEDLVGAMQAAVVAIFSVPPAVLGRPAVPLVVHLRPREYADARFRRCWTEYGYLVAPYLDGHPAGVPCGLCAAANLQASGHGVEQCDPDNGHSAQPGPWMPVQPGAVEYRPYQAGLGRWTPSPGWVEES